jgi:hypothetical protein
LPTLKATAADSREYPCHPVSHRPWTFTGTLSGNTITSGRHTLSAGGESISGNWQGSRAAAAWAGARAASRGTSLAALVVRIAIGRLGRHHR